MKLQADWILPYEGILDVQCGRRAKCRVRVYEDPGDPAKVGPAVLLTELADNEGESLACAADVAVAVLMGALSEVLDTSVRLSPLFICHYPPEVTHREEAYELVTFEELAVTEHVVELEGRPSERGCSYKVIPTVGEATFRPLDPEMVRLILG